MDHFLEDEVIGVEHLLAEPKCNNLGDDVLGFNTFSQETCCNFEEFSTLEFGSIKTDRVARDSNLKLSEKVKEEFLDGVLGRTGAIVLGRKNTISYTCEDYLLDAEFVEEASDLNPMRGPYAVDSRLESKCTVSGGRGCGDEISEAAIAPIPVLQTSGQHSSLLERMTIDELHEAFRNTFGCQTTVTDKQWLKHQLLFGLQNPLVSSKECEGEMISPTSDQDSGRVCTPFTGVFNFKKRRRVQHVKRERHDNLASLKSSSSEERKAMFGFSELGEAENRHVTSKRSRKPTQRYIDESLEQNSVRKKRRCRISNTCSNDKILHNGSYKQLCRKGFDAKPLVCHEVALKGACIQVPFGEPVRRGHVKKKVHESDGFKDSKLSDSKVDSDMESFSTKSQDDVSGDDYDAWTKTPHKGKSRRKNHIYWSVSEVSKLVEGVSMYGVGRWTEIKRLLFHSSANRTSVDLKDKWRNLLRASCSQLKSSREVESKRKHRSKPIPQPILHRVKELASIHPYPRERKKTASVASPIPGTSTTSDKLFPLSTAVRIM
ncbi:hypothetical protein RHSIM_Rhsim01G0214800 [Rhododendron simsii]|uniref:Uncharacterized protein n=1 Tax=Rhododendron simsii TaxID=118357 RepID=A0A834LZP3_RHOSS|nr:hypothetical protein RHSIM_Rhsim01G0214800 [Rhododendron simsii]